MRGFDVDRTVCAGAGLCALTAPEVFDQDEDGLVLVAGNPDELAGHPDVRLAVELCPSGALRWRER